MTELPRFDREPTLSDLLRGLARTKLLMLLEKSLGAAWELAEPNGPALLGPGIEPGAPDIATVPVKLEIDTIGQLRAAGVAQPQLLAAAGWLEMLIASTHRYFMASDLHLEAVHADYAALKSKHLALQESEARYRELADELEQRVQTQIKTIERTQRQMYQTEKMAAVGSLAAGMAHEINNPVGFIRSNLNTAMAYVAQMGEVLGSFHNGDPAGARAGWQRFDIEFVLEDFPRLLDESLSGADRVAGIVGNLKTYADSNPARAAALDLNDSVLAATDLLRDQLPDTVALDLRLSPLPAMQGDAARINHVLLALLNNARQAVPGGGTIRVSTTLAGNEILLEVSDDGCGIAPEHMGRIFDPFFTTRGVGEGMGLGLTVSRDVITAHGGSIAASSRPGVGTTVTVRLPGIDPERVHA